MDENNYTRKGGKSWNMAEQCSDGWGSHFLAVNDWFFNSQHTSFNPRGKKEKKKNGHTIKDATDVTLPILNWI